MSDAVLISIIGGFFGLAGLFVSGWNNIRLGKIHKQMNNRMDEMLELTRKEAEARGKLEGQKERKK